MWKLPAAFWFFASQCACLADGLENGKYEIRFDISDMVFTQVVTITKLTGTTFDIVIDEEGSLNLRPKRHGRQNVNGVIYSGNFKFVVPSANVVHVYAYYFEGKNVSKDGKLTGNGISLRGLGTPVEKFSFVIRRLPLHGHPVPLK